MEFVFNFFLLLFVLSLFGSFVPPGAIGSVLLFFAFIGGTVGAAQFVVAILDERKDKGDE
jgi:ABC-type multidrug transport system permease subunit